MHNDEASLQGAQGSQSIKATGSMASKARKGRHQCSHVSQIPNAAYEPKTNDSEPSTWPQGNISKDSKECAISSNIPRSPKTQSHHMSTGKSSKKVAEGNRHDNALGQTAGITRRQDPLLLQVLDYQQQNEALLLQLEEADAEIRESAFPTHVCSFHTFSALYTVCMVGPCFQITKPPET